MAIRTYKVTLDSKNTIAPEPVFLRQGDKTGAVVIDATLMDNGSPVSLNGLTPMFKANTADGQAVIADSTGFNVLDSANGEFTYQVPNALSTVPGKITTAYFSFSDSSGSESTFDVAFIIKKAVDITQAQADDYITIIDGTIQSLQQKIDLMNTDIQTILNAYNQGDFYNKSETDGKDAATLASAKTYADKDNYYTKAELDAKFNNLSGVSSWQTSGITLGSGVRWYSDEAVSVGCFKVIDFGGWQLVMIHGAVTNVTKAGQAIINLPTSIAPDMQYRYTSPATGQKHNRFLLDTNGNLVSENMSTGTYGAADWLPFDTLYLRKG